MSGLSCDYCAADFMEGEACSDKCGCVSCKCDMGVAPFRLEVTPEVMDALIKPANQHSEYGNVEEK